MHKYDSGVRSQKRYCVYIMSNKSHRLYVGVSSNLHKRVFQHKNKLLEGFTSRYNFDHLVYFEIYSDVHQVIDREKELKGWRREKKITLIETQNPDWFDLAAEWYDTRSG